MNVLAGPQQQVQVVPRLPNAQLGAEQTIFRSQLFKNEMLAWAICVSWNNLRSAHIERGARAWGCVGLHKLDTKWLGKMGMYGLGMCRPTAIQGRSIHSTQL